MKKLEEILYKKSIELESQENEQKQKAEKELKRKEIEKLKQKEQNKIAKNKAIINSAKDNALSYGLIGLVIGAVIGFGKGCVSYGNSYVSFSDRSIFLEPFRYIIPNALIIGFVGVVIGILVGINKGQNN
jgi:ElaB/YqjD/DUF883 family membrane-anchored ribosome-binding protein